MEVISETKTIKISKYLLNLAPTELIQEVFLHEVAHALTPFDFHGKKWKEQMKRFGLEPKRFYEAPF